MIQGQQTEEAVKQNALKELEKAGLEKDKENVEDFYDVAIDVPSFEALIKDGWQVLRNKIPEGVPEDVRALRIGVFGNFKKGKTWLLSKLTHQELNPNQVVHTPGICSKMFQLEDKWFSLLDIKGENSVLDKVET